MLENAAIWHLGNDTGRPWWKKYMCLTIHHYYMKMVSLELSLPCPRERWSGAIMWQGWCGKLLNFIKFKHTQTHTVHHWMCRHWINWIGFNTSKGARTVGGKTRTVRVESKHIIYLCVNVFLHFLLLELFLLSWQHFSVCLHVKNIVTQHTIFAAAVNYAKVLSN